MFQRILTIILILVIVLFGGFYAYRELLPPEVVETTGPVYSTKEVIKGDISVGVETTGRLDASYGGGITVPGQRNYGGPSVSYIIEELLAKEGDNVEAGQIIGKLKSPDIEMQIEQKLSTIENKKKDLADMVGVDVSQVGSINPSNGITLNAPIEGRITNLAIEEGDDLELGEPVCRIVDNSKYRIRAKLVPAEKEKAKEGQTVSLKFKDFDSAVEAKLIEVSSEPVPDNDNEGNVNGFVYWAVIEGENPGLIQPGMSVQVSLSQDTDSLSASYLVNGATVDSYMEEERVINRTNGIATEVFVRELENIKAGDPILAMTGPDTQKAIQEKIDGIRQLEMEVAQLKGNLNNLDIKASMAGVISHMSRQEGESVMAGDWIGSIFNTNEMMLWTQVDDIDILKVKQEATVKVTVDALPGESFEGKVQNISTRGNEQGGVTKYDVYINVSGDAQLKPGMQANAYIDAGSAEDALLVPIEAVFEEDGKQMVEILKDDEKIELVTIEPGLMNDRYLEVKEGLELGDLVVTGSSADILPSQHIKSNDSMLPSKGEDDKEDPGTEEPGKDN